MEQVAKQMISLSEMTETQYQAYFLQSSESYAKESPHYRDIPFEQAILLVREEYRTRFAPQGLQTPGSHFLAINLDQKQIGTLHVAEYPLGSKFLFAYNFEIDPEYRGKGLGKETMDVARLFFKNLGYQKMKLNVFATNKTAISLYEKFGFEVTQMNMERTLD